MQMGRQVSAMEVDMKYVFQYKFLSRWANAQSQGFNKQSLLLFTGASVDRVLSRARTEKSREIYSRASTSGINFVL